MWKSSPWSKFIIWHVLSQAGSDAFKHFTFDLTPQLWSAHISFSPKKLDPNGINRPQLRLTLLLNFQGGNHRDCYDTNTMLQTHKVPNPEISLAQPQSFPPLEQANAKRTFYNTGILEEFYFKQFRKMPSAAKNRNWVDRQCDRMAGFNIWSFTAGKCCPKT